LYHRRVPEALEAGCDAARSRPRRPVERLRDPGGKHCHRALLQHAQGLVSLRTYPERVRVYRAAFRGNLHSRHFVAARHQHSGAHHHLPRFPVYAIFAIRAVRARVLAPPLWKLSAPRADFLGVLHDRDDYQLARHGPAAQRKDRGHHLVAALRAHATKASGDLRGLEGFSPLVVPLRQYVPFDLRILPLVPISAPGESVIEGNEVTASRGVIATGPADGARAGGHIFEQGGNAMDAAAAACLACAVVEPQAVDLGGYV